MANSSGIGSRGRTLAGHRIEDANAGPGGAVLGDETVVQFGFLVVVVGGLVLEDDVQPDVPVAVVHVAGEVVGEGAAREEDDAGVAGQVLPAGADEALAVLRRA